MRIYTKVLWDMVSLRVIHAEGHDYSGPVALACGASGEEKAAFGNEKNIADLMKNNFIEFAGENQAILDHVTGALEPIVDAGPSQFGMTPAEEAAERTSAAENINAAGAQAANAVRGALASRGGGTTYLPSGSEASILGTLAQDTAVKEALAQSQITQRGYDIGRQDFEFATEGLFKAPGELESPVTQAGGAAVGAAGQEMQGGEAITQANQAWMAPVAQIIGGVAGGFIPKIPGVNNNQNKTATPQYGPSPDQPGFPS